MSLPDKFPSARPRSARTARSRSDYLPIRTQVWCRLTDYSGETLAEQPTLSNFKKAPSEA